MQVDTEERARVDPRTVLSIILGGGAGTRLYPLTKGRAKPAVSSPKSCLIPHDHHSIMILRCVDSWCTETGVLSWIVREETS